MDILVSAPHHPAVGENPTHIDYIELILAHDDFMGADVDRQSFEEAKAVVLGEPPRVVGVNWSEPLWDEVRRLCVEVDAEIIAGADGRLSIRLNR